MVGIKYNSLDDLNGQAVAWCNKVNGKVHATTNEIPFERLKKENLSPLSCEYIIDKINLHRDKKIASSRMPAINILYQQNTPYEMWQSSPWTICSPPTTKESRLPCIEYRTRRRTW
jgi:hypothetical protein